MVGIVVSKPLNAQEVSVRPTPIVIEEPKDPLVNRLERKITLDVRDMNVVDVLKFLALKGDFNLVTSSTVQGRVTLYLKSVKIIDALDIVLLSNALAYYIQNDIIYVMTEVEYEDMLGKKFSDKNKISMVQLHYAKPSYILATLENIKSKIGRVIIDEDTGQVVMIDSPQVLTQMQKAIEYMETPLEPMVYSLQYAKADVVAEKLQARIDAHAVGSITTDVRSNKLIVRAFPGRREEVEKLIRSLDTPTKEVLVEARVLQVTFKPKYDVGIDWELDFRESTILEKELRKLKLENTFMNASNLPTSDNLSSTYASLTFGDFTVDQFEAAIRALRQVSDTKVLSNPKLLVTNNSEAKIHVGDTIPYIISTTSGTGDSAITSEDVRFVDVGIQLNVTPTINDDGYVTMTLKPEISTVTGYTTSQGGGIPQVNKTQVETTIMIKDGTTIVLGGLKKENRSHTKKGIPFLMDIPIVDKLFSRTTDAIESVEIVIFITPHIITGDKSDLELKEKIKPYQDYKGVAIQNVPREK